jgi:multidrug efflux pump subunit AcrB
MKTKQTLIDFLLRYRQPLLFSTALLVLFGVIALVVMPRDEFPEFKIRQGLVIGVYPGASSREVEEQLTKKVENYLFRFESIDKAKTHSISKENVMVIYVEVGRDEQDPRAFWSKLRHGLNELKPQLPAGVMTLTADDDFGNTSAVLLAVESETKTYRELEKYIEAFEDDVRTIPATSRVKHFGLQKEEINIYIDDAKLAQYGIKPIVLLAALRPAGGVNFVGKLDDGKHNRPIHVSTAFACERDLANQIVYADPLGSVVRVKDVARIVREYREPDSFIRLNGKKCLIVSLEMLPGRNIVGYGKDIQKAIDRFTAGVPSDVHVGVVSDMPDFVSAAILNFLKEFGLAIVSVILVTVILLPRRVALVAASAIPVSVFITLGIMWLTGIVLQTVSLAALIIVLGMVVDNAIVIVDNYVEKLDNGILPREAASQSVTDLFGSVFIATLIIVLCFAPMSYLMTGSAGDFIRSMPMTVGYALSISLLVSVVLIPLLSYTFIRQGIRGGEESGRKGRFLAALQSAYDRLLEWSFRRKKGVILFGAGSFVLGILLLAFTPQQPFPAFQRNQFAVEVYLPAGSSLDETDRVMGKVEEMLLKDSRVKNVASFVGSSSPRFNSLYAPNFPGSNYGQLLVITESSPATEQLLDEYSRKAGDIFPSAHIRWKQLNMAVTKAPIEIRVSGDSIAALKRAGAEIAGILRQVEGVQWVRTDFESPLQTVDVRLKADEAGRMGYSKMLVEYALMVGTTGLPVSTLWEGDYAVPVNLKVDARRKSGVRQVTGQYITSPLVAVSVPLRQIADVRQDWSEGEIARRNGVRTLTVLADVDRDTYAAGIFSKVRPAVEALPLPPGMSISYGGEEEMSVEDLTPLYYALAVSIALIFMVLLAGFRKAKTALLIMTTMPLSIFGAAFGVVVAGYPFSVTAFIGLIGLIGIVVRNGIIYVSYAEELRHEHGHTLEEAAMSAARRRMRPIFLTSAAAAVGVVPMILSRSPLWGPLGSAICFGLAFALVLSLIVLPVLYYVFHTNDFTKVEEEPAL